MIFNIRKHLKRAKTWKKIWIIIWRFNFFTGVNELSENLFDKTNFWSRRKIIFIIEFRLAYNDFSVFLFLKAKKDH